MHIQYVHSKNFKRFRDITIDLGKDPKRIVALVGPNGSGKSCVLENIVFGLFDGTKYQGLLESNPEDFVLYNASLSQIHVYGGCNTLEYPMKYQLVSAINNSPSMVYFRNVKGFTSFLSRDDDGNCYLEITKNTIDRIKHNLVYFVEHVAEKYPAEQIDIRADPDMVKLEVILKDCLDIEVSLIERFADKNNTNSNGNIRLHLRKDDYPIIVTKDTDTLLSSFNYSHLSLGEREVFDILLDLYVNKDKYKDTIFLFDEPELHLNSAIQRKVFKAINMLIGDNCQIWVATHSIGVLRSLQEDFPNDTQIIKFTKNLPLASSNVILKPSSLTFRDWQEIFITALDDLNKLTLPNQVVLCEGARLSEYDGDIGFDGKIFSNIFGQTYPDTVFFSVGGCEEIDKYHTNLSNLISHVLQKHNNFTLLSLRDGDADRSGLKSSSELIDKSKKQINATLNSLRQNGLNVLGDPSKFDSSNVVKNLNKLINSFKPFIKHASGENDSLVGKRRYLARLEIENYLFDPEVLKSFACVNGLNFDLTSYKDLLVGYYKDFRNLYDINNDEEEDTENSVLDQLKVVQIKSNMKEILSKCLSRVEDGCKHPINSDDSQLIELFKATNDALNKFKSEHNTDLESNTEVKNDLKDLQAKADMLCHSVALSLSRYIKPDMNVYKELESCIFGSSEESNRHK